LHFALVVHDQSPAAEQPGECSLHDPAFGLLTPPARTRRALDYLELPVAGRHTPVGQVVSLVGLVSPDDLEAGHEVFQSCHETRCAGRIVYIGRRDVRGKGQAQRIHQHMAFAAYDALVGVIGRGCNLTPQPFSHFARP
jgi:hypothetical protein